MPKFALITTQVEEFDSKDALEHYIKEHSPLDFDDKVTLLKDRRIVIGDLEGETVTTIEIATEFAGEPQPPVDNAHVAPGAEQFDTATEAKAARDAAEEGQGK